MAISPELQYATLNEFYLDAKNPKCRTDFCVSESRFRCGSGERKERKMFIKKYWRSLSVFLVAVVSVGLYLQATQPPPEPIKIYKPVEPLATPTQAPTTQTPVGEKTEQGGHWHGDEWHAEPHTPQTQNATHTEYGHAALSPEVAAGRKSETPTPTVSVSSGGTVPLPTDLHDPVAWAAYYQAVEPKFPSDVDNESAWDAYIHALDPPDAKEPADVLDRDAWMAYLQPLRDEWDRVRAAKEKLRERLYVLPPETFGETDRERALFFIEVYRPYTQALNRIHNALMDRLNHFHRRIDRRFNR